MKGRYGQHTGSIDLLQAKCELGIRNIVTKIKDSLGNIFLRVGCEASLRWFQGEYAHFHVFVIPALSRCDIGAWFSVCLSIFPFTSTLAFKSIQMTFLKPVYP